MWPDLAAEWMGGGARITKRVEAGDYVLKSSQQCGISRSLGTSELAGRGRRSSRARWFAEGGAGAKTRFGPASCCPDRLRDGTLACNLQALVIVKSTVVEGDVARRGDYVGWRAVRNARGRGVAGASREWVAENERINEGGTRLAARKGEVGSKPASSVGAHSARWPGVELGALCERPVLPGPRRWAGRKRGVKLVAAR